MLTATDTVHGIPTAPNPQGLGDGPSVKSAIRVLQIFEFFLEVRRPARAQEIARAISMPQSSTSVLLRSLRDAGYLELNDEDRTFLPTPRVALLGAWLDGGPIRDGRLIGSLELLSQEVDTGIFVATRIGLFSQYIYVLPARTALRFHIPIGSRRLLVNSATGFALLAKAPNSEIAALVRRTNSEIPDVTIDPAYTLQQVEGVRRSGYAFSRGYVTRGAGAIAMPLPDGIDRSGRALVVSVAGMLDDFEEREAELVEALRRAVERLQM
jgi:DNA-binding IclR family transcriptional regulator